MASKKIGDFDDGVSFRSGDQLLISRGGKNYRIDGASIANLATIASTGSYADLKNKPAIPTKVSDLTNDSGFLTAVTIANTGVAAGTYANPTITVQADGRITLVANGTGGSATLTNTGVTAGSYINPLLTIGADGRISQAANGVAGGGTASFPDQTGQTGKFLTTNGNSVAWAIPVIGVPASAKYWKVEVWNSTTLYTSLASFDLLQAGETFHTAASVTALNGSPDWQAWFDRNDGTGNQGALSGSHISYSFYYTSAATIKQIRMVQANAYPQEVPSDIILSCSDDGTNWVPVQTFSSIQRGPGDGVPFFLNVTQTIQKPSLPFTTGNDGKWLTVTGGTPTWAALPAANTSGSSSATLINPVTNARYWRFSFDPSGGNNSAMGKIKMFTAAGGTTPIPLTITAFSTKFGADSGPETCFDYTNTTSGWATANGDARPFIDVDAGSAVQPTKFAFTSLNSSYYYLTMKSCMLYSSQDGQVYTPVQGLMMQDLVSAQNFTVERTAAVVTSGGGGGGGGMVPPPVSLFCSVQNTAVGASPNVRYSRGVASVSKIDNGVYKITFSTPFSDLFYAVEGSCRMENDGGSLVDSHLSIDRRYQPNSGKNVDSVYVVLTYQGAGIYDPKIMEFWMRAYDPRLHM